MNNENESWGWRTLLDRAERRRSQLAIDSETASALVDGLPKRRSGESEESWLRRSLLPSAPFAELIRLAADHESRPVQGEDLEETTDGQLLVRLVYTPDVINVELSAVGPAIALLAGQRVRIDSHAGDHAEALGEVEFDPRGRARLALPNRAESHRGLTHLRFVMT